MTLSTIGFGDIIARKEGEGTSEYEKVGFNILKKKSNVNETLKELENVSEELEKKHFLKNHIYSL